MSRKRKKKTPLRNDFTDALDKEISERKIVERTATAEKVPEVIAATETISAATATEKISSETVSAEVTEKVSLEKVTPAVEVIEVAVDAKLEERILKEADNTFFEEKPSEELPRKTIYRSKGMQRWAEEQREEKLPPKVEPAPKVETPKKLSRPEKFGVVVAAVMLIYSFVNFDKPLFFLAMALFTNFIRPAIGALFGKHDLAVQNALHTFSIVAFFGALFFLFTS